jgi:dTDP-4-amino-4,6-dideoxygalactose transaminase
MEAISGIARNHNLRVIEDAAHAMLATAGERYLGAIGDLGCFSFHETKNIISGEGGALLVNDPELVDRARIIWEKGTNRDAFNRGTVSKYTWIDKGSSFLPSELTAAFLFGQLEKSRDIIEHRLQLWRHYRELLQPLEDAGLARLPRTSRFDRANGHLFYLIMETLEQRDQLIDHLKQWGIMAAFHYVPLHSSPAGIKYGRHVGTMHVTDRTSAGLLRLPMHSRLTDADVIEVSNRILSYFNLPNTL